MTTLFSWNKHDLHLHFQNSLNFLSLYNTSMTKQLLTGVSGNIWYKSVKTVVRGRTLGNFSLNSVTMVHYFLYVDYGYWPENLNGHWLEYSITKIWNWIQFLSKSSSVFLSFLHNMSMGIWPLAQQLFNPTAFLSTYIVESIRYFSKLSSLIYEGLSKRS